MTEVREVEEKAGAGEFQAGGISNFLHNWKKLTQDESLLQVVKGCKVEFIGKPPVNTRCKAYPVSKSMSLKIDDEIQSMVGKGILRETVFDETMFLSPIFVRQKKSGALRLILDLKELNTHIPYKHFKMEMFENALKLVQPNMFMCCIDISDAYYSIKIREEDQKYFSFEWNSKLYSYTCMPNGWGNAPYIFTKLLKPVFYYLRSKGHINSYYIDDSLLLAMLYLECKTNYEATKDLLISLGFALNVSKSISTPTQIMVHLGNVINTITMTVYLPDDKKEKIKSLCSRLYEQEIATIRFVSKVLGTLISSFSAVEQGKLHYRNVEIAKIEALRTKKGNFNATMSISPSMQADLAWWMNHIDVQERTIVKPQPTITITTDSSMLGWGCIIGDETFNGRWAIEEQAEHINVLETKAILLAIQSLGSQVQGQHVRVLSDSTTAVTYVNKMGGTKSTKCNELAKEIWAHCIDRNAWISCQHIPGVDNIADRPSRKFNDDIEWQLRNDVFQNICRTWDTPEIDLFASRTNHKLKTYCSWKKDPDATFIDAHSLNWRDFKLSYIFPPFSLIPGCLQKLQQDRADSIMVVPLWPQQLWFPQLLRCLIDNPRVLPSTAKILHLAHTEAKHPLSPKLKLIACLVSGEAMKCKAFRKNLSTSSWPHGETQQGQSTQHTYLSGSNFAVQGTTIPFLYL